MDFDKFNNRFLSQNLDMRQRSGNLEKGGTLCRGSGDNAPAGAEAIYQIWTLIVSSEVYM